MNKNIDNKTLKLCIGICTYKRPVMLKKCLHSLQEMIKPDGIDICIIVSDNDKEASAKPIIDYFKLQSTIPLYYCIEEKKGIAYNRNNILIVSNNLNGSELAFIDDDEFADKLWLITLWNYYISIDVDVVWGWVKTIYPSKTPKWIIDGNFFQLPKYNTGIQLFTAYTGNVLLNLTKIVNLNGIFFDEECFSLGEDEDFFMRVANKGCIIHYLAEAVVYETLAEERMNELYYLKRLFLTKNNKKIFKNLNFISRLKIVRSGLLDFIRSIYSIFLSIITLKKYLLIKGIGLFVSGVAKILGFVGLHFKWN